MGMILDAAAIILGGFLGMKFKKGVSQSFFSLLGICIMLISAVGVFENIFSVSENSLVSNNLIIVVFSLIIGSVIGEMLCFGKAMDKGFKDKSKKQSGFLETTLFFAVGGLQISGPMLLAVNGDNSQLILKSLIDLPFAIMFGASLGVGTLFSAIPVLVIQVIIFLLALLLGSAISANMISQLCTMGYIILFFSGFNMTCDKKSKINNVNMLPSIFINVLINVFIEVVL